jgi:pimeloyl-ACP methyl ester carboxylesterase
LGLTSVVLVGHSDGGLLALMAAAKALKSRDSIQVCLESFPSTYSFLWTCYFVIYAVILR